MASCSEGLHGGIPRRDEQMCDVLENDRRDQEKRYETSDRERVDAGGVA